MFEQSMLKKAMPWLMWMLGSSFVIYQFMLQTSASVMVPGLMKSFRIDPQQVGVLSASFFYTYLIFQMPAGALVDRFGAHKVLTIGFCCCAVGVFLFAAAKSYHLAILARLLIGLSTAPAVAGGLFVAANWFPVERFALAAGLVEGLGMLGGVFGEPCLAQCLEVYGWRYSLVGVGMLGFGFAGLIWFFLKDRPKYGEYQQVAAEVIDLSFFSRLLLVLRMPQVWLNGLFSGLSFALLSAFAGLWAVPFLQTAYHFTLTQAAWGSSLMFLGVTFGGPFWGYLSGKTGAFRRSMSAAMIVCLMILLMIVYFPLSAKVVLPLFFCLGFMSSVYVLPFSMVKLLVPYGARGTAMGFTNMLCIGIGAPVLQPLIGAWLKHYPEPWTTMHFQQALLPLPICVLLALLVVLMLRKPDVLKNNEL